MLFYSYSRPPHVFKHNSIHTSPFFFSLSSFIFPFCFVLGIISIQVRHRFSIDRFIFFNSVRNQFEINGLMVRLFSNLDNHFNKFIKWPAIYSRQIPHSQAHIDTHIHNQQFKMLMGPGNRQCIHPYTDLFRQLISFSIYIFNFLSGRRFKPTQSHTHAGTKKKQNKGQNMKSKLNTNS